MWGFLKRDADTGETFYSSSSTLRLMTGASGHAAVI